jgi:hypothetical protein
VGLRWECGQRERSEALSIVGGDMDDRQFAMEGLGMFHSLRGKAAIKPQLTRLVDEAPAGGGWLHEIKYAGYRMHARIDGDQDNRLELVPPILPTIEVIEEEG